MILWGNESPDVYFLEFPARVQTMKSRQKVSAWLTL